MSDESETNEVKPSSGPSMLIWLLTSVVCVIAGTAVPFVISNVFPSETKKSVEAPDMGIPSAEKTVVVPYGEVTVNLDEGRMNRYLRLKIALLVSKDDETEVLALVESHKAVLKNWLLSYLSDKQLDEIRGKVGLNMLRREIRKQFNDTLFSDRRDRIYDILFEEFNVQ